MIGPTLRELFRDAVSLLGLLTHLPVDGRRGTQRLEPALLRCLVSWQCGLANLFDRVSVRGDDRLRTRNFPKRSLGLRRFPGKELPNGVRSEQLLEGLGHETSLPRDVDDRHLAFCRHRAHVPHRDLVGRPNRDPVHADFFAVPDDVATRLKLANVREVS